MKTTETQQKVLDCISKFSNSNAEQVANVTGLNKLLVFKIVKALADGGLLKISDSKPSTYQIVKDESKNVKASDKKTAKVETTKKVPDDEVALNSGTRDTSKLKFNGEQYGKGRLVLAVVKKYLADHPRTSYTKLKEVFPDELQQRYGLIQEVSKAKKLSEGRDRFFLKPEDLIKVGEKKIAICNQFGSNNLSPVLKQFRALGYTIR